MTIVKLMVSTLALGVALTGAQPTGAQLGGPKRRPLRGASQAEHGGAKKRPLPGTTGEPGARKHGKKGAPDDAGPPGKRVAELKQKEQAGTLTEPEKAELEKMKQHRQRAMKGREARWARQAELEEKKKAGKLTDEEKAELDKIGKVQARYEALKQKHVELRTNREERRRAAKRSILKEHPKLGQSFEARAEYGKHARRMARLERAREIAETEGRGDWVARVDKLLEKEQARHRKWLDTHKATASEKGAE